MKKVLAFVLAIMMMSISFCAALAVEPNTPITTEEEFEEILDEIEYDPNPDYDKYTVIYYFLEDISADMYTMVSAKEDNSEFCLEVFWYGVDDKGVVTYDAETETCEITVDESGFMKLVAEDMIKLALEQDMWKPIEAAE